MKRDAQRVFDEYLVFAARSGDRDSWTRLVQRWQPRLIRHAWRLCGDVDEARDRVQESWLEIVAGLQRLDDVVAFPAWALCIVTRRCQRGWGAAVRRREEALDACPEPISEDSQTLEFAVDLERVVAAMQSLPAGQRAALALHHLEQLSVAEIAIALDVPPGTVKTRLMHARRKLRALLGGPENEQD